MIAAKNIRTVPLRFAAGKISLPQGSVAEIRLRTGRSACAVMTDGRLVKCSAPFSRQDIGECFLELCGNSVHSFAREISEGYITLPGGHRVGFCGTAVEQGGRLSTLKDISSLNIRFASEVRGCAEELCARAFGGVPALDIGENTDVLNGYSRGEGIMCALRSLSPEVIICDEIGGDAEEIRQCMNCGVKLIVSAHAGSIRELMSRPALQKLLPLFERAALLEERGRLSELADIPEIRS